MTKDETLKLALEALENLEHSNFKRRRLDALIAIHNALAQPEIVQVSPLEFVTRVTGKEEMTGKPVFWTQWPTPEIDPNKWAFDHGLEST